MPFRVQYILLKYKKYIQLYNGYIQITWYIDKLHNNNKVYIYIHNCYTTPNITNDKEEAVQLIYLLIDTIRAGNNTEHQLCYCHNYLDLGCQ